MYTNEPIAVDDLKAQLKPLVLVVDDDQTHLKLIGLLADKLNITPHLVPSCAEAVKALNQYPFELILMDYRMPEVDGCVCTQRIRIMKEFGSNVPIIAVTAHIMQGAREKCLAAGMDDFLGKPFTVEELHEKLCYWLAKKSEL